MKPGCIRVVLLVILLAGRVINAQDVGSGHITLLSRWHAADMVPDGNTRWYNEVWGFERDGREYAVMGSQNGIHILEITPQNNILERGFVKGKSFGSNVVNRDMYVYGQYLYTVCDQGYSSLQIIDLSYLPDSVHKVYDSDSLIAKAHTLWIDENSEKLYVCGPAGYAMKIFDVTSPTQPQWIYTHTQQAYVHDCYVRNDTAFLNCGTEGLYIYRFNNFVFPFLLGVYNYYSDQGYNHSGKLNHRGDVYVFTDETPGKRIKLTDVSDLTDIQLLSLFSSEGDANSIAHDAVFFRENYIMTAYYTDGLAVFDIINPQQPALVAWYDTYPQAGYMTDGAWGVYVLPSEKILVSDRMSGLFVLEFNAPPRIETGLQHGVFPNPVSQTGYFWLKNEINFIYSFYITDALGNMVMAVNTISDRFVKIDASRLAAGVYTYRFISDYGPVDVRGKFIVAH